MNAGTARAEEADATSLLSALTSSGKFGCCGDFVEWLAQTNRSVPIQTEQVEFGDLAGWSFEGDPMRLAHDSGRFFSIDGILTTTTYGPRTAWEQPIIHQPEIGILGIITRLFDGVSYFLLQCKSEPGNVNGAQLSPTVQATRSNYSRVHKGRTTKYLEYFTGEAPVRVLADQLQSEQGSRFLGKRNRNMIVQPLHDIEVDDDFRWMTLGQIKDLLKLDNIVNMDARSVLSLIPLPAWRVELPGSRPTPFGESLIESVQRHSAPLHTITEIVNWFTLMRVSCDRAITRRPLDQMAEWRVTNSEIRRDDGRYFSVIGVQVEIGNREVSRWFQPLLAHPGKGLNGMITQRIDGVLHFLIRACFYPGNLEVFEMGSTVSRSDYEDQFNRPDAPPFLDLFCKPDPSHIRHSSLQSEEGGRFYHYQNRYMILELPPKTIGKVPANFMWMTLGQIQQLLPHGYFNIEARNLLACLHLA